MHDSSLQFGPLTRVQRRAVFYLAVFLFFVIVPLVIFYSLGYNVDVKNRNLFRTGGIFVKTNQTGFRLFINNQLSKESSFISYGTLVTGLKPDLYSVRIEKEGFRPWLRFIHVEAESVSEFRYIFLIPEKLEEKEILDLSRRNLTFSWFEALPASPWVMIGTKEKAAFTYLFNRETKIFDAVEAFDDFRWDSASRRLLVKRSNPLRFAVVLLASGRVREEKLRFPKELGQIKMADFYGANNFLVLGSDGKLSRVQRGTGLITRLLSDMHSFAVSESQILFISNSGFFSSSDLGGENIENYGKKGFFISEGKVRMETNGLGDYFLVDSAGGFFIKRRDEPEVAPFSGNVLGAEFTSSGNKLLFWSKNTAEALWLAEESHQPFRKAGERQRVLSLGDQTLSAASWLGPLEEHVVFGAGLFLGIVDIDNRGGGPSTTLLLDNADGPVKYHRSSGQIFRASKSFLFATRI